MQPEPPYKVFLGFDAAEIQAYNVAELSLQRHTRRSDVALNRICMNSCYPHYTRPTRSAPNGQLFDEISGAPMSTSHAIARFFVPFLCGYQGWALFTDGDVLFREDITQLFALARPQYAVQVVQHPPLLEEGEKKSGHVQQPYFRKNWSSVILWNCGHPANAKLTREVLNGVPGRDLHAFHWLQDSEVGSLPARWNYLVGQSQYQADPALVHFTKGTPNLPDHAADQFADEWWATSRASGYKRQDVGGAGRILLEHLAKNAVDPALRRDAAALVSQAQKVN